MSFTVVEYRPAFFEGFEQKRSVVESPQEALQLDWLKAKGAVTVEPYHGENSIVMSADKWVLAIVWPTEAHDRRMREIGVL